MNAALPSASSGKETVLFHPAYEKDFTNLEEKEFLVAEALELNKKLTLHEISKILAGEMLFPW